MRLLGPVSTSKRALVSARCPIFNPQNRCQALIRLADRPVIEMAAALDAGKRFRGYFLGPFGCEGLSVGDCATHQNMSNRFSALPWVVRRVALRIGYHARKAHARRKMAEMKILAGNSNRALTEAIAAYLGLPLTKCQVRRFADMEVFVEILENVRGQDTFIIQSTSYPANDHLMEVLIMTDALRRASARRITAVIPYFGYARQDRKPGPRTPISAKLVANLITRAGADRVLTVDLHAGQIQGFFDIPTDNLYAAPVLVRDIKQRFSLDDVIVVSPDVGGVVRARALAKRIGAPLAIVDKRRERAGDSEVMNIIGDVAGKTCILVDDIVDSGDTLCNAADALLREGAQVVYAYITHGVLSGGAVARIAASRLKELVLTDTIQATEAIRVSNNIRVVSIAPLIGEAIARIAKEESVSSLFD